MAPQPQSSNLNLHILPFIKEKHGAYDINIGSYNRYKLFATKRLRKIRANLHIQQNNETEVAPTENSDSKKPTKKDVFVGFTYPPAEEYFSLLYSGKLLEKKPKKKDSKQNAEKMPQKPVDAPFDKILAKSYLEMFLFESERYWAYAMELKQEMGKMNESGVVQIKIKRIRRNYLKQLNKAEFWSKKLFDIANEKFLACDNQTILEADAYHNWMAGNLNVEKENWEQGQSLFLKARTVYDNLSTLSEATAEHYKKKLQEIDASIRFCRYNLSKKKGETPSSQTEAGDSTDLASLIENSDDPAFDLLKSKLNEVLEESRKQKASQQKEFESLNGRKVVITNEPLKILLIRVETIQKEIETKKQAYDEKSKKIAAESATVAVELAKKQIRQQKKELQKEVDSLTKAYNKLFALLSDCQQMIRDDMKLKEDNRQFIAEMRQLHTHLLMTQIKKTIEKNLMLIEFYESQSVSIFTKENIALLTSTKKETAAGSLFAKLSSSIVGAGETSEKERITPLHFSRLYEIVLQNFEDLEQLPGVDEDTVLISEIKHKVSAYRVFRQFYLSQNYTFSEKYREGFAGMKRTELALSILKKDLATFLEKNKQLAPKFVAEQKTISELEGQTKTWKGFCVAKFILENSAPKAQKQLEEEQVYGDKVANAEAGEEGEENIVSVSGESVLSRLGEYKAFEAGNESAEFPPRYRPLAPKPEVFDVASNFVQYPSLEEKTKPQSQQKKGWFSGWFSK